MSKTWKGNAVQNEACGQSATMTFPIERSEQEDMLARIVWFLQINASINLWILIGMIVLAVLTGFKIKNLHAIFTPISIIMFIVFMVMKWKDVPGEKFLLRTVISLFVLGICQVLGGFIYLLCSGSNRDVKDDGLEQNGTAENNAEENEETYMKS